MRMRWQANCAILPRDHFRFHPAQLAAAFA
jgi:hypothetical protein